MFADARVDDGAVPSIATGWTVLEVKAVSGDARMDDRVDYSQHCQKLDFPETDHEGVS